MIFLGEVIMKSSERTCENCKAEKNGYCMCRPNKYAKECGRYRSSCKKCGGSGLVSMGINGVRGLKPCRCMALSEYKKKHCIPLDDFI